MKPIPVCSIDCATCSGCRLMFAPSASSTSALPDDDDTLRPPCLATRAPAAAATNIDAVEILKVCAPSPPVPTMSSKPLVSSSGTLVANSRMTCAAAAISPMVSFLTRRPMVSAAIISGDISPDMILRNSDSISSWKISRCSMQRSSACCGVIDMMSFRPGSASQEVLQQLVAMLGEYGLRMELHALDVEFLVAHAHDLVVCGPGGHFQAVRQRRPLDGQRVIAGDGIGIGQALEDADAGMVQQ